MTNSVSASPGRLAGHLKWAIFLAIILSVASLYEFFFGDEHATKSDLRKVALPILENDMEIVRAWKKMDPAVSIDTSKFSIRLKAARRILGDSVQDVGNGAEK